MPFKKLVRFLVLFLAVLGIYPVEDSNLDCWLYSYANFLSSGRFLLEIVSFKSRLGEDFLFLLDESIWSKPSSAVGDTETALSLWLTKELVCHLSNFISSPMTEDPWSTFIFKVEASWRKLGGKNIPYKFWFRVKLGTSVTF